MSDVEKLSFLTDESVRLIANTYGSPVYVYDESTLKDNARQALGFPHAYGLTVRYAMKACPTKAILKVLTETGIHIDASSLYEVKRALMVGITPEKISLTAQELQSLTGARGQADGVSLEEIADWFKAGLLFNAASMQQIQWYGECRAKFPEAFPATLGIRFNPGEGSGGNNKTNVGGPNSSFGVWYKDLEQVKALVSRYQLEVERIHTHIGSGSDPEVWKSVAEQSLSIVEHFPTVTTLNLGGGFKVGRMAYEHSTDLQEIGAPVKSLFEAFFEKYQKALKLEIEPGTFLVANTGAIISEIIDRKSTLTVSGTSSEGQDQNQHQGHQFLLINSGMNDLLRPALYGSQHPLVVVPAHPAQEQTQSQVEPVVVCGHNCESGDLLTPEEGDSELIKPRVLQKSQVGDFLVVEGVGAYASSMSACNYNSFPTSAEVLFNDQASGDEKIKLIRKRQSLSQMLQNEI